MGAEKVGEGLDREFRGEIPLDVAIRETSDSGQPIAVARPDSEHAETYRKIAASVWEKVSKELDEPARQAPRIGIQ